MSDDELSERRRQRSPQYRAMRALREVTQQLSDMLKLDDTGELTDPVIFETFGRLTRLLDALDPDWATFDWWVARATHGTTPPPSAEQIELARSAYVHGWLCACKYTQERDE